MLTLSNNAIRSLQSKLICNVKKKKIKIKIVSCNFNKCGTRAGLSNSFASRLVVQPEVQPVYTCFSSYFLEQCQAFISIQKVLWYSTVIKCIQSINVADFGVISTRLW